MARIVVRLIRNLKGRPRWMTLQTRKCFPAGRDPWEQSANCQATFHFLTGRFGRIWVCKDTKDVLIYYNIPRMTWPQHDATPTWLLRLGHDDELFRHEHTITHNKTSNLWPAELGQCHCVSMLPALTGRHGMIHYYYRYTIIFFFNILMYIL